MTVINLVLRVRYMRIATIPRVDKYTFVYRDYKVSQARKEQWLFISVFRGTFLLQQKSSGNHQTNVKSQIMQIEKIKQSWTAVDTLKQFRTKNTTKKFKKNVRALNVKNPDGLCLTSIYSKPLKQSQRPMKNIYHQVHYQKNESF